MSSSKSLGLDMDILKRISRDKLIRLLEEASGPKDFIIDNSLMKILDRIADLETLRVHGVNKIFRLERLPPSIQNQKVLYLIAPTMFNIKYIADHYHSWQKTSSVEIHVICVPRKVSVIDMILEEEGLFGIIRTHEFPPEFISLDSDLLSLELNSFFKDAFQEQDFSACIGIARAISTIDSLYGPFPSVFSYGRASQAVVKAFDLIKQSSDSTKPRRQEPEIGHLMIFDRETDFITPLLTQLTYEGTLDEHFGITAGVIEFPEEVCKGKSSKVVLNCSDTIFDNIRNRHFADVGSRMSKRTKELQDKLAATKNMQTAQLKDYVSNEHKTLLALKHKLTLHISACETITKNIRKDFETQLNTEHGLVTGSESNANYISDCMSRELPYPVALRLICLYSITRNGLTQKEYESFSTEFCNAYGFNHIITFHRLRTCGLLLVSDDNKVYHSVVSTLGGRTNGNWLKLAKKFNLINMAETPIDLRSPTNMSYVFNGTYTPAIPQIVMEALTKGYAQLTEALKTLGLVTCTVGHCSKVAQKVVFVLLLGGVTYSEIAALRLLSVISSSKIIIASTGTLNGKTLVSSACFQN